VPGRHLVKQHLVGDDRRDEPEDPDGTWADRAEEVAMSDALALLRAAACWLASVATVSTAMLLRADSDGPRPGWPVLVAAMALLAVVFWPMTASRRRLPAFVAALVALQLSGHALLLYASTGRVAHSGASGLFCCPSTPGAGNPGLLSTLTANAGWLLLLVQLLVVAVLAVPLRLLQGAFLALAQSLAALVRAVTPVLSGLVALLSFRACTPPPVQRSDHRAQVRDTGRHVAGAVRRRGPPRVALVRSSTPFATRGACA
jgi:hypothetical protein